MSGINNTLLSMLQSTDLQPISLKNNSENNEIEFQALLTPDVNPAADVEVHLQQELPAMQILPDRGRDFPLPIPQDSPVIMVSDPSLSAGLEQNPVAQYITINNIAQDDVEVVNTDTLMPGDELVLNFTPTLDGPAIRNESNINIFRAEQQLALNEYSLDQPNTSAQEAPAVILASNEATVNAENDPTDGPLSFIPTLDEAGKNNEVDPTEGPLSFIPTLDEADKNDAVDPTEGPLSFIPTLDEDGKNAEVDTTEGPLSFIPTLDQDPKSTAEDTAGLNTESLHTSQQSTNKEVITGTINTNKLVYNEHTYEIKSVTSTINAESKQPIDIGNAPIASNEKLAIKDQLTAKQDDNIYNKVDKNPSLDLNNKVETTQSTAVTQTTSKAPLSTDPAAIATTKPQTDLKSDKVENSKLALSQMLERQSEKTFSQQNQSLEHAVKPNDKLLAAETQKLVTPSTAENSTTQSLASLSNIMQEGQTVKTEANSLSVMANNSAAITQNLQANNTAINFEMGNLANNPNQSSDALADIEQALPITKMNTEQWQNALHHRVSLMIHRNLQDATIRLDPPELGSIQIKLHVQKDNTAHISFSAPATLAREAIEDSIPKLKQLLQEQGIDLQDTHISSGQEQQSFEQGLAKSSQHRNYSDIGMSDDAEVDMDIPEEHRAPGQSDRLLDFYA